MSEFSMPEPRRKRRTQRPRSDPNGFIVLACWPYGGFHVTWCRSDSGAEKSRQNAAACAAVEVFVIPVSDLLAWRKSGVDELEAMFRL